MCMQFPQQLIEGLKTFASMRDHESGDRIRAGGLSKTLGQRIPRLLHFVTSGKAAIAAVSVSCGKCVYRLLTTSLECPASSLTAASGAPAIFISVTKLCRKLWKLTAEAVRRSL